MFNLFEQQANKLAEVKTLEKDIDGHQLWRAGLMAEDAMEAWGINQKNNVVVFPTVALAQELHAQGKVIIHRPSKPKAFEDGFTPDDAA